MSLDLAFMIQNKQQQQQIFGCQERGKTQAGRIGKRRWKTPPMTVEPGIHWSSEEVTTFLRSLGTPDFFQTTVDQVLEHGVDDSVLHGP